MVVFTRAHKEALLYNICRISHPRALDHASILIPLALMQDVIKSIEAMAVKVKHEHEHDVDGCSRLMLRIPRAYFPRHPSNFFDQYISTPQTSSTAL